MSDKPLALDDLLRSTEREAEQMQRRMVERSLELDPKLAKEMTVDGALGALHDDGAPRAAATKAPGRGFSNTSVTKPLMLSSMKVFINGLGERFLNELGEIERQRAELDNQEEVLRGTCKQDLLHYLGVVVPVNGVVSATEVAAECDPLLKRIGVTRRELIDALKRGRKT